MKRYPLQLIALDESTHQAIKLLQSPKFDEVIEADLVHFPSQTLNRRQILLLSNVDEENRDLLIERLQQCNEPILLLPDSFKQSEELKLLLSLGTRVILYRDDSLNSIHVAKTVEQLELFFYGTEDEAEIVVEYNDIYQIIDKGTISEISEQRGTNIYSCVASFFNVSKNFDNCSGVYILFQIPKEYTIVEIAEAMDVAYNLLPEDTDLIFATRHMVKKSGEIKVMALISRYYDFIDEVDRILRLGTTYISKVSTLANAYVYSNLDDTSTELLMKKHNIAFDDFTTIYFLIHTQPKNIAKFLEKMLDKHLSEKEKCKIIVDAIVNKKMQQEILDEITEVFKIPKDCVEEMIKKNEENKYI